MTRTVTQPHRTRTKTDDGDVRYDATVTGYNRARRGRVRNAQEQVQLLTTKIIRDTGSASVELQDGRFAATIQQAAKSIKAWRSGTLAGGDARADLVQLAATAILWAETIDTPVTTVGPRIRSGNAPRQKAAQPVSPPKRIRRRRQESDGQLELTF